MFKLIKEINNIIAFHKLAADISIVKFNISDSFIKEIWIQKQQLNNMVDGTENGIKSWTRKFVPQKCDKTLARDIGLITYRYRGEICLVLPGSKQDNYPLIDAYQALVDGSIPSVSLFFTDRCAFKNILGGTLFRQVKKAITIKDLIIQIKITGGLT